MVADLGSSFGIGGGIRTSWSKNSTDLLLEWQQQVIWSEDMEVAKWIIRLDYKTNICHCVATYPCRWTNGTMLGWLRRPAARFDAFLTSGDTDFDFKLNRWNGVLPPLWEIGVMSGCCLFGEGVTEIKGVGLTVSDEEWAVVAVTNDSSDAFWIGWLNREHVTVWVVVDTVSTMPVGTGSGGKGCEERKIDGSLKINCLRGNEEI